MTPSTSPLFSRRRFRTGWGLSPLLPEPHVVVATCVGPSGPSVAPLSEMLKFAVRETERFAWMLLLLPLVLLLLPAEPLPPLPPLGV